MPSPIPARRLGLGLGLAGLLALAAFAVTRPGTVLADLAAVRRGTLTVAIEDDGETRVREIYRVSAPLPGRILRFAGKVGDEVVAGETVIARILPQAPAFLDLRRRSELEAARDAAQAGLALAEAEVERIRAEVELARSEYQRAEELHRRGAVSVASRDRARTSLRMTEAALQEAQAQLRVRRFELETAEAALLDPVTAAGRAAREGEACCLDIRAPVSGRILRIFEASENVVAAGAPLVEIGDPEDLEIVVDLLSSDAVRVSQGDEAEILRWGGEGILAARVRRIEPFGFTKISALGIEEQRVNVILDLTDPYERWARLGHGFRIEARLILRRSPNALLVPSGAVFREGDGFAAFALREGRAALVRFAAGADTGLDTEVLSGLEEGERVVLYPSDRIADGTRIKPR